MSTNLKLFVVAGLLVGLGLAILVSPFASSSPDGLEKVAGEEGFALCEEEGQTDCDESVRDHDTADSPLADYGVEGIDNEKVGTGVAGLIGTLVTMGVGLGLFALIRVLHDRDTKRQPAHS